MGYCGPSPSRVVTGQSQYLNPGEDINFTLDREMRKREYCARHGVPHYSPSQDFRYQELNRAAKLIDRWNVVLGLVIYAGIIGSVAVFIWRLVYGS